MKTSILRAELSRSDLNKINKWLDTEKGMKETLPLQIDVVRKWRAWEKENGFDGPQARDKNVPKELEASLKEIIRELDDVKWHQLKLAIKGVKYEERKKAKRSTKGK